MKLNEMPPGSPYQKLIVPLLIIVLILLSFKSLLYTVAPDEVGVIRQLGKYVRQTGPGLHMKLPWGIETVVKVRVQYFFKEEFGFRTKRGGVRTEYFDAAEYQRQNEQDFFSLSKYVHQTGLSTQNPFLAESLMLTGDLNAAEVEWIIQYRVKDAVAFAFHVRDIRDTIRAMSEAVMREVVGDAAINEVLTVGKDQIEQAGKQRLQAILDELKTGVNVTSVVLQDVNPPVQVKASFNEVNEARQDKERFINQAWEEYNRVIPKSQGEADQTIRAAEGYAMQRVNRAKGDAERFEAMCQAYEKAPEVTRRRMYIETMTSVLPKLEKKIILDSSVEGILPLLNVSEPMLKHIATKEDAQ